MHEFLNAVYWMDVSKEFMTWLIKVLPGLIIVIVLIFLSLKLLKLVLRRLARFIVERAKSIEGKDEIEIEKRVKTLVGILLGIGKIVIWSFAIMIMLPKFGVNIAPILAGAGIVGLAVGFGAQELVRDFISGFFMILENQIRTGDVAVINGTGGLVEKIELRTITLRDFSGVVHIFQNGKVNTLSNMTKEWSASVLDIGVAYKEDTDKVIEIMKEVGAQMEKDEEYGGFMLEPIEIVGVDNFADSAVIIKIRIKTKPSNQWRIGREYRRRIKKAFDEKGIEIPFPHTTVYWGEKTDPLKLHLTSGNQN